jgi:hypothetical protein
MATSISALMLGLQVVCCWAPLTHAVPLDRIAMSHRGIVMALHGLMEHIELVRHPPTHALRPVHAATTSQFILNHVVRMRLLLLYTPFVWLLFCILLLPAVTIRLRAFMFMCVS